MTQRIYLDTSNDDIYTMIFDRPDSSANIFDTSTFDELEDHIKALAGDTRMQGLIFQSAKESIFIAGADIGELAACTSDEELTGLIERGQRLFQRIAALPAVTVAAIHGAALGGGYELCLACDFRIASGDRATKIGLPETQLGILPAWGGCARLPRLIGLPKALDVILAGKRLAAKQALRYGMVDQVVPREHLVRMAMEKIAAGKPLRRSPWMVNNPLSARVLSRIAGKQTAAKTRGNYPAVSRALDVVVAGVSRTLEDAMRLERDAVVDLAATTACRNLIRVYFMQDRAKRLKPQDLAWAELEPGEKPAGAGPIRQVAVIGAGVMGAGIAQWISTRGYPVLLRDIGEEPVRNGLAHIARIYQEGVKRHQFDRVEARRGLDRIAPSASDVPMPRVGLVIEAAVEDLAIKRELFRGLAGRAPADALLASNTSALSITELGRASGAAGRVIGLHFFNPVHRMPLLEIVLGEETSLEAASRALAFAQRIGKLPVVVRDRPGFLVNRILMPYLVEAGLLFMAGASARELDETMLNFGMPMGPLRLIDEVGVDVCCHVAGHLAASFPDRLSVPPILDRMKQAGRLGRKSGRGFYRHDRRKPALDPVPEDWVTASEAGALSRQDPELRMVYPMLNEAARCLEDGVAPTPGDIDFAMIMGTGFAPFHGGPLRYADTIGIAKLCTALDRLAASVHPRFTPCRRLRDMKEEGETFYSDDH